MRISSIVIIVGFLLVIAGIYCPLLRPFHLLNWNLFALNKPYAVVMLIVAVLGIGSVLVQQRQISKFAAFATVILVILLLIAAVMKVKTAFSFIPFKGIASGLSHLIKFQYGWWFLIAGSIIATVGVLRDKQKFKNL